MPMRRLLQVWRKGGGFVPLALYATQLALNLAWSPIFFKKHELGFALADITGAPHLASCPDTDFALFASQQQHTIVQGL